MKKILCGGILIFFPVSFFAQLLITEVYRDTPYSEYIDENYLPYQNPTPDVLNLLRKRHRGEFIEIFNASDTDVNLKDWKLQDDEGSYDLPSKIIKSGEFIVVAANNNANGDYFPLFFSTTQGKESQIIYQNAFKLSNGPETIALVAKNLAGQNIQQEYATSFISFDGIPSLGISVGSSSVSNNSVFYEVKDWQYGYSTDQIPNPLDATIKPLIKPLDDYFGTQLTDNYDQVTWDINAENLLINFCNISIPAVSQNQNTTPTSGGKSFIYDTAGNSSASSIYNPGTNPTLPNGYSSDELLQIKNAIILSPNPTYDIVNVNITGIAQGKVISVNVLSGNGSLLFTKTDLNNSANYFFTFNLSNQITGVYIANFTLNTGQVVTKNVIKY